MSSAAKPPSDRRADSGADSPIDQALLAFLSDPTPTRQAALFAAAQDSPEVLAEIQEFLAGDAELQQMMQVLGPLATNMLASEATLAAGRDETLNRLDDVPIGPVALVSDSSELGELDELADGLGTLQEPLPEDPREESPTQSPASAGLVDRPRSLVWPVVAGMAAVISMAALAFWLFAPREESMAGAMRRLSHTVGKPGDPARPRRSFVPSADLWTPPVVTPGVWHYAMGEQDLAAREGGLAADPMIDRKSKESLVRQGKPTYAPGLVKGSLWSVAFAGGDGYTGPILTTATDNFCLEAWFKVDVAANTMVVNNGNGGFNGFGLILHDNGHAGRVTYMGLFGGNRFLDTNVNVTPGVATHLAVARVAGQTTVYLNGRAYPHEGTFPNPADGAFHIGLSPQFKGQVDEVRLWVFAPGQFKPSELLYPILPTP